MKTSLSPLLFLLFLAGLPQAQVGFDVVNFDPAEDRELGETYFLLRHGAFRRTCALELNGDFRQDALVLVGDQLVCTFSPGIYHALVAVPRSAVDMCPLLSGRPRERDSFLVSSERARLERWQLDPLALEFELVGSIGAPIWAGATELHAADLDGDGIDDILGLSADRQTVIQLAAPFQAGAEEFLARNESIHRAIPIEWDGTAGAEIALLTPSGLGVYEPDGQQLFLLASGGGDNDRFCAVKVAGQSRERLAALLEGPEGEHALVALDRDKIDAPTPLGLIDPVAIVSGDRDGDGHGDVCISHKSSGMLIYFHNQKAVEEHSFGWNDAEFWDPTSNGTGSAPAPENEAHPLIQDLDQDGDGDLYFPVEAAGAISMLRNVAKSHLDSGPTVAESAYQYDQLSQSGSLRLTLDAPLVFPAEDERLLVLVWRQATMQNDVRTESDAIYRKLEWLTGWPLEVAIPLVEPLSTTTLFHIEFRLANTHGKKLRSAAATSIWTFTTSASSKNDMIFFHGVLPETIQLTPINGGGGGDGFQWIEYGWTGPMPCIPCFADDEVPYPGQADFRYIRRATLPDSTAITAR